MELPFIHSFYIYRSSTRCIPGPRYALQMCSYVIDVAPGLKEAMELSW